MACVINCSSFVVRALSSLCKSDKMVPSMAKGYYKLLSIDYKASPWDTILDCNNFRINSVVIIVNITSVR